eukprot:3285647-Pyramimonas_sp.AAC.1
MADCSFPRIRSCFVERILVAVVVILVIPLLIPHHPPTPQLRLQRALLPLSRRKSTEPCGHVGDQKPRSFRGRG